MTVITETSQLQAFCSRARGYEFVTVDTEFLREHTYFAKLCVLQLAYPGEGEECTAIVDVLADGLSLDSVVELFQDNSVVKVFHAARQDLEIFFHDYQVLPYPFYDTQVAGMVAGFGEQVGYETLVKALCNGKIDKTSRFTDWSHRPLSEAQVIYARSDVSYLRDIYLILRERLSQNGRSSWVEEELAALIDPSLYKIEPEEQWKRIRARSSNPKFLGLIRELAAFRERFAIEKNIPRTRVMKDDLILEIAAQRPNKVEDFRRLRLWPKDQKTGPVVEGVLSAVARACQLKPEELPVPPKDLGGDHADGGVMDLLKVFLKTQSERHNVASRLICSSAELEAFASKPDSDHPLSHGWKFELFGQVARELIEGKVALRPKGKFVEAVRIPDDL